jgi:hypothetical protein
LQSTSVTLDVHNGVPLLYCWMHHTQLQQCHYNTHLYTKRYNSFCSFKAYYTQLWGLHAVYPFLVCLDAIGFAVDVKPDLIDTANDTEWIVVLCY